MYKGAVARMVRKQVYIEPAQEALLKRQARILGVTEAELIRQGVDRIGRMAVGQSLDARAWQQELAFIRKRARKRSLGRRRRWTREELYADRLGRLSR